MGQKLEEQDEFEKIYKNAWADNANACAKQYAGTGALKTDFTRTGKRTQLGLIMDGWNSLIRYYKNNFSDGFRQVSLFSDANLWLFGGCIFVLFPIPNLGVTIFLFFSSRIP